MLKKLWILLMILLNEWAPRLSEVLKAPLRTGL